ncbi:MAG: hypothetical protein KIS86_06895 [Devosia sp.]|nr:hypothetical protein [Devosia sp.]
MPSGVMFDLANPRPEMVRLSDIVHKLLRINRWGGNIEPFTYTLAQHSMATANACELPAARPYALLHHAPAAYVGDPTNAQKEDMALAGYDFVAREKRVLYEAILPAFGLPAPSNAIARAVDKAAQIALATELRDIVAGKPPGIAVDAAPLRATTKFVPTAKLLDTFHPTLLGALRPFGKVA